MTTVGSLFSGVRGLDMAVEAVFGGETRWMVENNKAAATVLAHRAPDVPNLGDITAIDWRSVEPIDVLCGGFPCQDVSAAGRRAGIAAGTRSGLWKHFAAAIDTLRPRVVVIENVRGLLSAKAVRSGHVVTGSATLDEGRLTAAGAVLGDLADLGYDARWSTVAASDIGACHQRKRVFIVAHPAGSGNAHFALGGAASGFPIVAEPGAGDRAAAELAAVNLLPTPGASDGSGGRSPAKSGGKRPSGSKRSVPLTDLPLLLPTPGAADCTGGGADPDVRAAQKHHVQLIDLGTRTDVWGKYEPAIRRWEELTRSAPRPIEPNSKGNPRLAAAFSEWMMGWPEGWVTDFIASKRRPIEGEISRNDALRLIGNGVVTQQAYAALTWLLNWDTDLTAQAA